jgi:predicted aldo/keto reductase-like oxidoreductase
LKKLGFGLMRLPMAGDNVDIEQTKEMVDLFLERGFTYFDTALMYCNSKSEAAIKQALVDRYPRQDYTLATKLHAGYLKTKEDRDRIFSEQLERTGAGYFDYYLLHSLNREFYDVYTNLDCFNWLAGKKEQGLVRHIGFSFHDDAALLEKVLSEHPEVEFVQLQINYLDWDSEGIQSRRCYEVAEKYGKPVIVMEPVKGGTLAKVPASVEKLFLDYAPDMSVPSWAIRFAAGLDNVFMVLSGMSNMEQMLDNTSYMMDLKPLSYEEQAIVASAVNLINSNVTIACTGCEYCVEGCPKNIAIPQYFSLYNADKQEIPEKGWLPQGSYYESLTQSRGAASDCIECGRCERVCPQHLPIIKHLKTVAKHFGK